MKMSIGPIPIIHPHHHQRTKDRIPQLFYVGQPKLLRHPTVVGPKLVVLVTLRERVVLPSELPLERGVVLLP